MSHTPGPWIIEQGDYSGRNWLIGSLYLGLDSVTNKEYWIHITTDHLHGSDLGGATALDDAHLIAAAPELLEALENIVFEYQLDQAIVPEYVRVAIAKAKGK
jgi:hypothetical protein